CRQGQLGAPRARDGAQKSPAGRQISPLRVSQVTPSARNNSDAPSKSQPAALTVSAHGLCDRTRSRSRNRWSSETRRGPPATIAPQRTVLVRGGWGRRRRRAWLGRLHSWRSAPCLWLRLRRWRLARGVDLRWRRRWSGRERRRLGGRRERIAAQRKCRGRRGSTKACNRSRWNAHVLLAACP